MLLHLALIHLIHLDTSISYAGLRLTRSGTLSSRCSPVRTANISLEADPLRHPKGKGQTTSLHRLAGYLVAATWLAFPGQVVRWKGTTLPITACRTRQHNLGDSGRSAPFCPVSDG